MRLETKEERQAVSYLLGELKGAEQERLEERFFTDSKYSDFLEDIESDLIDCYVRGELSDAQRERFEKSFLISQQRREKVHVAHTLYDYEEANQPKAVPVIKEEKTSLWSSVLSFFATPKPVFAYGFAALALFLLLSGIWLFVQNNNLRDDIARIERERQNENLNVENLRRRTKEIEAQANNERGKNEELNERLRQERERLAQAESRAEQLKRELEEAKRQGSGGSQGGQGGTIATIATFILPPAIRDQAPTEILLPRKTKTVRLQLTLEEGNNYPSYRVELKNSEGNIILNTSIRGGKPRKSLSVKVPAKLLGASNYELSLKGITKEGQSEDIAFYEFIVKRG